MSPRVQVVVKNLLLAFVLVSVGFALGKRQAGGRNDAAAESAVPPSAGTVIRVYYLHSAFRCASCNQIEAMTKALLEKDFSTELADGRIVFSEVDFQVDEALARRFGVVASCVVVARERDGRILDYRRLDGVWELLDKPAEFYAYVAGAVRGMLAGEGAL